MSPHQIAAKIELSNEYDQWFEIVFADTSELKEKAYRLRYQVYCCEHQYENPEEHPDGLEMDAYDCRSLHSLITDRLAGAVIGTVRLVLPNLQKPESSLPIQHVCSYPLLTELIKPGAAEVSRFAISKVLRKMVNVNASDHETGACPIDRMDVRCSLILGLMKATVQMSLAHGITDWFAVMEPCLLRLLARFGIHFKPLGPLVDYHGFRQPCYANFAKLLEKVHDENYDLWAFVTESGSLSAEEELAVGCSV